MADRDTTIDALRERLTDLLAEWGAEMSAVLTELEQSRRTLASADERAAQLEGEIAELTARARQHDELISTLRTDADAASHLQRDLAERDLEIERLRAEVESKQELIRALRRDAEDAERARGEIERKEQELADLRRENERLEAESRQWQQTAGALEEAAAEDAEDSAEIESLRADLEARKSLIRSLRADAERAQVLEGRLDEKRQLVQQLEATINRHASTIVELKRIADAWKRKYRTLKGFETSIATATDLGSITGLGTGVPQLPAACLEESGASPDRTIAIDMRQALIEARRAAQSGDK